MEQPTQQPELLHPFNPKQNRGGRPSKLTDAVAAAIAQHVANGNFFETAAGAAGVDYVTMRSWLVQGQAATEQGKTNKYSEFLNRLNLAQQQHEAKLVETLSRGGDGKYSDWRAQEVILSRRYKARWAEERTPQPAAVTINIGTEAAAALADALAVAAAVTVTDPLQTQKQQQQPKLLESLAAPSDSQSGSADPDKSSSS